MKLCKDCKFFSNSIRPTCGKTISRVTGEPLDIYDGWRGNADLQREDNWLSCRIMKTCGKEGRWWEPKEETKEKPRASM